MVNFRLHTSSKSCTTYFTKVFSKSSIPECIINSESKNKKLSSPERLNGFLENVGAFTNVLHYVKRHKHVDSY